MSFGLVKDLLIVTISFGVWHLFDLVVMICLIPLQVFFILFILSEKYLLLYCFLLMSVICLSLFL